VATPSKPEQQLSPEDSDGHSSRRTAGLIWITCGRIIQVASYNLIYFIVGPKWLALSKHFDLYSVVECIILLVFAYVMLHTAVTCVRHGRKLRTYSAEEIMRKDPRPPVLYLRSFARDSEAADAEIVESRSYDPATGSSTNRGWLIMRTEEEQVVHVLQTIGPVIAIGKPGDTLPELGATRRYLKPGEDWQDVVEEWMAQASVVVLHAGTSPGLLWELQIAKRKLSHEQLLILLSLNPEEYLLFKKRVEQLWASHFPYYMGRKVYGSLTGCIYFKPGWKPCFLGMEETFWYGGSLRPLAPVLKRTLQPFFDQFEQVSVKSSRAIQENLRSTQERVTKSRELSREGQITARFTKAIDQLRAMTERGRRTGKSRRKR